MTIQNPTRKQRTRLEILRAIAKVKTAAGVTAKVIAKAAGLHVSTIRRHLADMRQDGGSALGSHLIATGTPEGFLYSVRTPLPRIASKATKKVTRTSRPVRKPTPVTQPETKPEPTVVIEVTPTEPPIVSLLILTLLEGQSLGLHEIGQVTRIKRGVLQREIESLGDTLTRTRVEGRWVYSRAS